MDSLVSVCLGGIILGLVWAGLGLFLRSKGMFNVLSFRGPLLGIFTAVMCVIILITGGQ